MVASAPFFPVGRLKLVVMSIVTFGIYELYWMYQNWKRIKEAEGEKIDPFWRAFFGVLWAYSLFEHIEKRGLRQHLAVGFSPGAMAGLFFALNVAVLLPDPFWLITFASVVPLVIVQRTTDKFNAADGGSEDANANFSGPNIFGIVAGGALWALVVLGTFFGDQTGAVR